MALEDGGIEILSLAAADRGDEVAEVTIFSRSALGSHLDLGQWLGLGASLRVELAASDRAGLQVEGIAHGLALVRLAWQSAAFQNQQPFAIIENGTLAARGLALVRLLVSR